MSEDEIILTHILGYSRSELLIRRPVLTGSQDRQFQDFKSRRAQGEPLQYILGSCEFYGLEFKVDGRVLVPRPETETLVDLAIQRFRGTDILDLGTGCGNIAVTLAKFLPYSKVTAVDISVDALALAIENAQHNGVEGRVEFVNEDMTSCLRAGKTKFDLIISNPPYIPTTHISALPDDVRQEPVLALDGGKDGLKFTRAIIEYSPSLLRRGACLMMECGDGQVESIKNIIHAGKAFSDIEVHKDLTGKERVIISYGKIRH